MLKRQPKDFQTENWLFDPEYYWEKVGELPQSDLRMLVNPVAPLWIDGYSTYNGLNDKIPTEATGSVRSSLTLVHVDEFTLSVFRPGEAFGNMKRRVQGRFSYARQTYALWVTDPVYERSYLAKPDREYQLGECFLTISLGEPYGGACYKLIASVIAGDHGSDS